MEVLAQQPAVEGGQGEPAVAAAVAVVDQGEGGGGGGIRFFLLEAALLVGLADLRCDDVEDASAEDAQGVGVVVGGVVEQHVAGLRAQVVVDQVVREVVDRAGDHVGLVGAQPSVGQGSGDRLVERGAEALGEPEGAAGLAAGDPGAVGPPGRGVPGADRVADPTPVGLYQRARQLRGQP